MRYASLSRRGLMGRRSMAAVAASLGSSLVSETGSAAVLSNAVGIRAQGPIAVDASAGVRTSNVRHYAAKESV